MASPAVVRVHLCYWILHWYPPPPRTCNVLDQLQSHSHLFEASMSRSLHPQAFMNSILSWLFGTPSLGGWYDRCF